MGLQILVGAAFLPREVAPVPRDQNLRARLRSRPGVSFIPQSGELSLICPELCLYGSLVNISQFLLIFQFLRGPGQCCPLRVAGRHHQVAHLSEAEGARGHSAQRGRAHGLRGHRTSLLYRDQGTVPDYN